MIITISFRRHCQPCKKFQISIAQQFFFKREEKDIQGE